VRRQGTEIERERIIDRDPPYIKKPEAIGLTGSIALDRSSVSLMVISLAMGQTIGTVPPIVDCLRS
jgi:hypothetical protein